MGFGVAPCVAQDQNDTGSDGKGIGTVQHPHQSQAGAGPTWVATKAPANGISYHGGPILLGTTNVYY